MLAHYDLSLETWVETDALDFVVAGVLLQMHDEVLKPVTYYLKKMTPVECNYMIYDKKLLAIIKAFKIWKPELASVSEPVKVLTDHKNLEHFMTTKQLNHWQTRWAKFLSEFNFKISYRPGKEGEKPDVLTKHSQNMPKGFNDYCQQQQFQTLLTAEHLDDNMKKALERVFSANTVAISPIDNAINAIDDGINAINDLIDVEKDIVDAQDYVKDDKGSQISVNLQHNSNLTPEQGFSSAKIGFKVQKLLKNLLQKTYKNNKVVNNIIAAKEQGLWNLSMELTKRDIKLAIGNLMVESSDNGVINLILAIEIVAKVDYIQKQ